MTKGKYLRIQSSENIVRHSNDIAFRSKKAGRFEKLLGFARS